MKDPSYLIAKANTSLYEEGYVRSGTTSDHFGIFSIESGNRIGPEIPLWKETRLISDFIRMDLTEDTIISCLTEWYLQHIAEWNEF